MNYYGNQTSNDSGMLICHVCSEKQMSTYEIYNTIVITILIPIVGFCGCIGNALASFVYSRPVMRSSVNLYLCALAASDFLVIFTAFFLFFLLSIECSGGFAASYLYGLTAPYIYPVSMTVQTASVYFVIAAAMDCFVCSVLSHKIKERFCTSERAKTIIYIIVSFSVVYNLVHWFEVTTIECFEPTWNVTTLAPIPTEFRRNPLYYRIYYTYLYSVIMAIGPLILLIVLNTTIIIFTFAIAKNKDDEDGADDSVTLILVVFLFILCNSLALIINFLETFADLGPTLSYLVDFSNLLVVVNSSVNFIIYYAFGDSFRRTLKFYIRYRMHNIRAYGTNQSSAQEINRSGERRSGVCERTFYGEPIGIEENSVTSGPSVVLNDFKHYNEHIDNIENYNDDDDDMSPYSKLHYADSM